MERERRNLSKRAQVTIFIILGILIVIGIVLYFIFAGLPSSNTSNGLQKGEAYYLSCIQARAELGIKVMGQQGGYIYVNELPFYPGSSYMPTSSQLDFYGSPVPYWLYISGNNILREQKPTLPKMQQDLARFIKEGISSCDFSELNAQGVYVDVSSGDVNVQINDNTIDVSLNTPVYVSSGNESSSFLNHKVSINSKLGKFYKLASAVLDKEENETFLESYGLDVMNLYAPVTGVDFSCAPEVFNEAAVDKNITDALELNIDSLKLKGSYYTLQNKLQSYYEVNIGQDVSENVNFLYSPSWPTKIDMAGDKVVQPIGNQPGMGMFGMCFVPYHFVYNIAFPVLVQFYDGEDLFQFGLVADIQNSQPRQAVNVGEAVSSDSQICSNANQDLAVHTYDLNNNPIAADLTFTCLTDSCDVGSTTIQNGDSVLNAKVPACVNAVIDASADGYAPTSYTVSTNSETSANIYMKKIFSLPVNVSGASQATIIFSSPDYTSVLNYPQDKIVNVVEGEYNITALVYSNTSINFQGATTKQCLNVPSGNVAGALGATQEQCYNLNVPNQTIDSALVGGGMAFDYFTEDQFNRSKAMEITVPIFKTPQTIQELQDNYLNWETSSLVVNFV